VAARAITHGRFINFGHVRPFANTRAIVLDVELVCGKRLKAVGAIISSPDVAPSRVCGRARAVA
jgi:hypothetical protein